MAGLGTIGALVDDRLTAWKKPTFNFFGILCVTKLYSLPAFNLQQVMSKNSLILPNFPTPASAGAHIRYLLEFERFT